MEYPNIYNGDTLTNKVEINLYTLCLLMLNWIGGQIGNTHVVTIDQCDMAERMTKFTK